MLSSRYELILIEESFDAEGKLDHRRETKYVPEDVHKLQKGLDRDIINFFEKREGEFLFFTHLYEVAKKAISK